MIVNCIKLILLVLSNFGYWEYFRSKHGINAYFAPIFTIAIQFCVLFAAGLLNYLKDAAMLLCLVGVVLLIISVRGSRKTIVKTYLKIGFLYFAVMLAAVAWYTHDRQFVQSDNFTHWATVVRNMLITNRFPGSLDTAVEFTSYPLGSSAMIYYYCKFLGRGEDRMMLAQAFMMLCAMLPVYAFARKRVGFSTVIIVIMTALIFQYNIPVTELLVDTLLPLAGMATVAFAYYQCVTGDKLPIYYALPMMLWTMNIKHAAVLYVAGTVALLWIGADGKHQKKAFLKCMLILLAARSLWDRHCSYINPEVGTSQHALSLNWFGKILADKTGEDILHITQEFLKYAVTRREFLWILGFAVFVSLWILVVFRQKKQSFGIGACILSMYAVYGAGVLGMYIFSMPVTDGLIAVDRYMKSGDIAIYYMILLFAVSALAEWKDGIGLRTGNLFLLILVACCCWFQTGEYSNVSLFNCTIEERQRWEAPIEEYGIPKKHSYLLCVSQEDYENRFYFPRYIWQYHLETSSVDQIVVTDEAQLDTEWKYDYVVVLDEENPVIRKWMQENYPGSMGQQVIQHFG